MSQIVSTPQQICNHPLNNSKSKFMYSFSRSSRDNLIQKPICQQAFYDLPEARSTRSTTLGYANKYDFTKASTNNPPPNAYYIKSNFGDPAKKKGFSFGLSRDAMAVTGGQTVGDKNSPGPAAYDVRELNKSVISFSFRTRPVFDAVASPKNGPGPGSYPLVESINPKGKYFISKYKSSGATIIPPSRSKRFVELKKDEVPGPGAYPLTPTLSSNGSYFVSKFRSSIGRSFGKNLRTSSTAPKLATTPGPGSYRLPSDFGYYEAGAEKTSKELN